MNFEKLVYIGDRESMEKSWQGRRYLFKYGVATKIPQDFADVLLRTIHFVRASMAGKTLEESHPSGGKILLRRWGALGDLIMFRAAASAFLRNSDGYTFFLRVQERFHHLMAGDPLWNSVISIGHSFQQVDYDAVVSMDQVAEQDHRGVEKHRVELFMEAMTTRPITITPEDWQIPIPASVMAWVERHMAEYGIHPSQREHKLVAVQVRGSGKMKTLPIEVVKKIIEAVRSHGHEVVLIENEDSVANKLDGDGVYSMTGRDALHTMGMLKMVDLAITMDSGPLWMAHVAACPTLAILGPTRAEQRISLHPQYPTLATHVALNELIDCKPCFESAKACGGRFDCIQRQPDWGRAVDLIMETAAKLLAGGMTDVHLPQASNPA